MKIFILLAFALALSLAAKSMPPEVDYFVIKKDKKTLYIYQNKVLDIKGLEESLLKLVKAAGTNIPINIRIGYNISVSETSKHLRLLHKLKFKDVDVIVLEKDGSLTMFPVETGKIEREETVEIEEPPPLPDEKK